MVSLNSIKSSSKQLFIGEIETVCKKIEESGVAQKQIHKLFKTLFFYLSGRFV